jgi:hypothetical protein
MAREKKLKAPVTLFAAIESDQHELLRKIAFEERRSIADVVREAIDRLIETKPQARPARTRRAS